MISSGDQKGLSNLQAALPVNLPDSTEIRGVAHPFPENSGQNASGEPVKGKTGQGLDGCPDCGLISCVCFDYDDSPGIGCADCDSGWRHGCCDDLCYGSNEPEWCDNAIACRHCNPHGEVL